MVVGLTRQTQEMRWVLLSPRLNLQKIEAQNSRNALGFAFPPPQPTRNGEGIVEETRF